MNENIEVLKKYIILVRLVILTVVITNLFIMLFESIYRPNMNFVFNLIMISYVGDEAVKIMNYFIEN